MQECGGQISLVNKEPYRASVVLEFRAQFRHRLSRPLAPPGDAVQAYCLSK
jgi:hypothetical protein